MTALTKSTVAQIRNDLDAALKAVAAKHGVDFSIGTIRFSADQMGCRVTGVARGAAGTSATAAVKPEQLALKKKAYLLGSAFDDTKTYRSPSLGTVKVVGYNGRAKKYPYIVLQVGTNKRYKITALSAKSIVDAGAIA
jgi:hypothetical protein